MQSIGPYYDALARAGFAPEDPDDRTTVRFVRDGRTHVITLGTNDEVNVQVAWRLPETTDERARLRAANFTNCWFTSGKVVLDATYETVAFSVCRAHRSGLGALPDLADICKRLDIMSAFFFSQFASSEPPADGDATRAETSGTVSLLRRRRDGTL